MGEGNQQQTVSWQRGAKVQHSFIFTNPRKQKKNTEKEIRQWSKSSIAIFTAVVSNNSCYAQRVHAALVVGRHTPSLDFDVQRIVVAVHVRGRWIVFGRIQQLALLIGILWHHLETLLLLRPTAVKRTARFVLDTDHHRVQTANFTYANKVQTEVFTAQPKDLLRARWQW